MRKDDFLYAIQELGLTSRRAAQLLQQGTGTFWWQSGDYIRLVGLNRAGSTLDLESTEGSRVLIPREAFFDLQSFKAYLYASWFARATERQVYVDGSGKVHPDGGKVIARETLRRLFGITKYTQRTYERLAGMLVEEQVAVFRMPETDVEEIPFTERYLDGEHGGMWYFDVDGDGHHEIVRQIPNRIGANLEVQKHKKRVKPGGSSTYRGADPARYAKTFFYAADAAERAVARGKTRSGVAYVRQHRYLALQKGKTFRAWNAVF